MHSLQAIVIRDVLMVVIKLPGEQGTTGEIYLAYLMAFPIILSRLKEDYSTPILKEKKR